MQNSPDSQAAFVDVSVISMNDDHVLTHQTVLIANGLIARIGPAGKTAIPPHARRIQAAHAFLIPGLADMHVHLQRDGKRATNQWMLDLFLLNGVTTVRNMWGVPEHLTLRALVAAGQLPGPTIITAGPIIDGPSQGLPGSTVAGTSSDAAQAVQEQKRDGYDFIKIYSHLSPAVYQAVLQTARDSSLPVAGHTPVAVTLPAVLSSGQKSIEHLDGYSLAAQRDDSPAFGKTDWYSSMIAYNFMSKPKLEQLVNQTQHFGVWNCPTLVTMTKLQERDPLPPLSSERDMRFVPRSMLAEWQRLRDAQLKNFSLLDFEKLQRAEKVRDALVGNLYSAGAPILAGTDTPGAFVVPGFALQEELHLLVSMAGLTPYAALRTATYNAADYLQALDQFGTIAAGKRADLVLLSENPLQDISHLSRIVGVMARGRWFSRTELEARSLRDASQVDAGLAGVTGAN